MVAEERDEKETRIGLYNLHDVFLNASLLRKAMLACPIGQGPKTAHAEARFRYERMWTSSLSILVEAWHSTPMRGVREYLDEVSGTAELTKLLRAARKSGLQDKLSDTRHYMCQKDQREFWDKGRSAPYGNLTEREEIHMAFSTVLLGGMNSLHDGEMS